MLEADIVHARLGPRRQPLFTSVTRTGDAFNAAALDQPLESALREWETRPSAGPAVFLPYRHVEGLVHLSVWSPERGVFG
jgi:hypothetical protein